MVEEKITGAWMIKDRRRTGDPKLCPCWNPIP